MRYLPEALWYEPADLGFNAQVIGASSFVTGKIVPWAAALRFTTIIFHLSYTGTAASITCRYRGLDQNGLTFLNSTANVWSIVQGSGFFYWCSNNQPRASVGVVVATVVGDLQGSPYMQFDILNNDAANSATVTMRAGLRALAV